MVFEAYTTIAYTYFRKVRRFLPYILFKAYTLIILSPDIRDSAVLSD